MARQVLSVEQLSKHYRLGVIGTGTLHDDFERWWARLRGRPDPTATVDEGSRFRPDGTVWALRDVTFSVAESSTVGVIGANGAGKSTLLKILSRVTAPSDGCVKLKGRVASLLEIGTGFHAELTGRENIFLNGTILGMRKEEVARKFDEIVAFADVGPYIDTPVKRYSSGMYVRLAFAVAAHLEPDILIVDEVLAVGDINFQKKCLGKMTELTTAQHRTVLFVSHNMASIKALCTRAILLNGGRLVADGGVDEIVDRYIDLNQPPASGVIDPSRPVIGTGEARVTRVQLLARDGAPINEVMFAQPFTVAFDLDVKTPIADAVFEVDISTPDGTYLTTSLSSDRGGAPAALAPGRHRVCLDLDVTLLPDHYTIDLGVHHTGAPWTIDFARRTLDFHALNVAKTGSDRYPYEARRGFVRPAGEWRVAAS
jgi:lipopolysaccharide transport system ATP-binding protein